MIIWFWILLSLTKKGQQFSSNVFSSFEKYSCWCCWTKTWKRKQRDEEITELYAINRERHRYLCDEAEKLNIWLGLGEIILLHGRANETKNNKILALPPRMSLEAYSFLYFIIHPCGRRSIDFSFEKMFLRNVLKTTSRGVLSNFQIYPPNVIEKSDREIWLLIDERKKCFINKEKNKIFFVL